jgi:hypothetical protein
LTELIIRRTAREGRFTWRPRDRWFSLALAIAIGGEVVVLAGVYVLGAALFACAAASLGVWRYLQTKG